MTSVAENWMTPAALVGFATSFAASARWLWGKFEKANDDRISDRDEMMERMRIEFDSRLEEAQSQTVHREAMLEKVLVILNAHNETAESTILLIKEIRDFSGTGVNRHRRQEGV